MQELRTFTEWLRHVEKYSVVQIMGYEMSFLRIPEFEDENNFKMSDIAKTNLQGWLELIEKPSVTFKHYEQ